VLWRRRNEGFEWKDYVRTTVLVRRRQRREKIDAAAHAAADALKDAGRRGVAAGAAGADAAGRGAVKLASSAAEHAGHGAQQGFSAIIHGASALHQSISELSAPISARLATPRLSRALAAVSLMSGAAMAVRAAQFGFDVDSLGLAILAGISAALWAWPPFFSQGGSASERPLSTRTSSPARFLQVGSFAAFTGLILWFAAPTLQNWLPEPAVSAKPAVSDEKRLSGKARVTGPAMLRLAQTDVRLDGITMLEPHQTCRRADGSSWACGKAAAAALEKLVRGSRDVTCTPSGTESDLTLAMCTASGRDIAAELVRSGHAFADGIFWATYGGEEAEARAASIGLWAGDGERPQDWRERLWQEATSAAPGGCPIKGRTQFRRKVYVIPGDPGYAGIRIREKRGERWFCSIEEAEAAGYLPR
jgi:endonuclease YncB( thermonuclease family)